MSEKLSVRDVNLAGKRVIIRVDFNVPMENTHIRDDTRIRAALETINYVLEKGGSAILMGHLGRPEGKFDPHLSLLPCAKRLSELIKHPVKMAPDCCGPAVEKLTQELQPGEVLLLENLRFHKGEEKPQEEPLLASALARLGDIYIDDAFGSAHRPHTSISLVPKLFPGKAALGFLLEKEASYLGSILNAPKRPFCVILGGSKMSTKFNVIKAFMQKADLLLIGGAMAFTFFKANDISVGDSLVENSFLEAAKELLTLSFQSKCRLLLPLDIVVTRQIDSNHDVHVVEMKDGISDGFKGVDIGPKTIHSYSKELIKAETIFWNGPLGVFESPPFDNGTNAIARFLAYLPAITIIGGGDSAAAVRQTGLSDHMSHISTGGGASLEYIEFGTLPGIEALTDKP